MEQDLSLEEVLEAVRKNETLYWRRKGFTRWYKLDILQFSLGDLAVRGVTFGRFETFVATDAFNKAMAGKKMARFEWNRGTSAKKYLIYERTNGGLRVVYSNSKHQSYLYIFPPEDLRADDWVVVDEEGKPC